MLPAGGVLNSIGSRHMKRWHFVATGVLVGATTSSLTLYILSRPVVEMFAYAPLISASPDGSLDVAVMHKLRSNDVFPLKTSPMVAAAIAARIQKAMCGLSAPITHGQSERGVRRTPIPPIERKRPGRPGHAFHLNRQEPR
jgi:hypothetical protein